MTSTNEASFLTSAAPYVGPIIGIAQSYFGGQAASKAARKAEEARLSAQRKQHTYNEQLYNHNVAKITDDWMHANKVTQAQKDNEIATREYIDDSNNRQWAYDLQIWKNQSISAQEEFLRSQHLYDTSVSFNRESAEAAQKAETTKFRELQQQAAFDHQDQIIESLQAEGQAAARGVSGRVAGKIQQSLTFQKGKINAMLSESIASGSRSTKEVLQEISRQQYSADLSAWANKMLPPGEIPTPIKADPLPKAEFIFPKDLHTWDFGPYPTEGAYANPAAAASQAWVPFNQGIASGLAGLATSYAKYKFDGYTG